MTGGDSLAGVYPLMSASRTEVVGLDGWLKGRATTFCCDGFCDSGFLLSSIRTSALDLKESATVNWILLLSRRYFHFDSLARSSSPRDDTKIKVTPLCEV